MAKEGIPKAAWYYGGEANINYIVHLADTFLLAETIPNHVNDLLFCFPPKPSEGPTPQPDDKIFKHPTETRPLSLKNEDNKYFASIINRCICLFYRSTPFNCKQVSSG